MLEGIYLVCNPNPIRNQYRQYFYLFQKLMILFAGIWILEEVLFQKYNPVGPRKMIWEFSGINGELFFSEKSRKAQREGWKGQQELKQAPLIQFCSAGNSMLSLLSFLFFVMTLYFLE